MRHFILGTLLFAPHLAAAEPYVRPIPQPQSATAELWFFAASLALICALWIVHKLVSQR